MELINLVWGLALAVSFGAWQKNYFAGLWMYAVVGLVLTVIMK